MQMPFCLSIDKVGRIDSDHDLGQNLLEFLFHLFSIAATHRICNSIVLHNPSLSQHSDNSSLYTSPRTIQNENKVAVPNQPASSTFVSNDSITRVGLLNLPYAEPLLDLKSSEDDSGVV